MPSQLDLRIKLIRTYLQVINNNQLFETVHPCLVSKNSYIGNVSGVMNAVILEGKPLGECMLQGEGAGPGPTSSSFFTLGSTIYTYVVTSKSPLVFLVQ